MSKAIENLQKAFEQAMKNRPKVGGFPFLAATLKHAGVKRNIWDLPSCQSLYITDLGNVVMAGQSLVQGMSDIAKFDEGALVKAIRKDQAGEGSFPEFLESTWKAGIVRYEVDFSKRLVSYFGALGESYFEEYPEVKV